jgi:hypothetical protein
MNMMTRLLVNKHADKDEIKHMLNTPKNLTCGSIENCTRVNSSAYIICGCVLIYFLFY